MINQLSFKMCMPKNNQRSVSENKCRLEIMNYHVAHNLMQLYMYGNQLKDNLIVSFQSDSDH